MITITVGSRAYGNNKQYIAHITGRAPKFNFEREFVGRKTGRHNDTTEYSTDEAGLFEDCDIDKKGQKEIGYLLLAFAPSGELVKMRADLSDALAIAKRLDGGEKLDQIVKVIQIEVPPINDLASPTKTYSYEIQSKAEAKAVVAAATVESATEACWLLIQALPPREARKVLGALKMRVSPPKTSPEPEVGTEQDASAASE